MPSEGPDCPRLQAFIYFPVPPPLAPEVCTQSPPPPPPRAPGKVTIAALSAEAPAASSLPGLQKQRKKRQSFFGDLGLRGKSRSQGTIATACPGERFRKDKRGSSYFRASLGQLGTDQKPQAEETLVLWVSAKGGCDASRLPCLPRSS
ncbi:hypothetical protein HispidOSU_025821 [Sigmodon hispidus]